MPKTLFQSIVFGLLMVCLMVYFMICYNIAMDMGGLTPQVFAIALGELPMMIVIAFVLESAIMGRLAKFLAFRLVNPEIDKPLFVILAISIMTVCCMCPAMSLIATIMHNGFDNLLTNWLEKWFFNFLPALTWQVFFAGPLVRLIFRNIFREKQPLLQEQQLSENKILYETK